MAKSYRFIFIASAAGGANWPAPGRQQFDVNDATANTEVITTALGTTPVATLDGLKTYIANLVGSYSSRNASNSGYGTNTDEQAAMLGGATNNTGATSFEFITEPGTYRIRLALGGASGSHTVGAFYVYPCSGDIVSTLKSGTSATKWTAGMTVNTGISVVSPVDGTVWRGAGTYTAGTDAPSGPGDGSQQYIDNNGAVWNRINYADGEQFKAVVYIQNVTTGAANIVVNPDGTLESTGTWGGVYVDAVLAADRGGSFSIGRIGALALDVIEFTKLEAGADTTPDAFSFTDVNDAEPGSPHSDGVTITGITATTPFTVTGGTASVAGGPSVTDGFVNNNEEIIVTGNASSVFGGQQNVVLDVNGVSDTFTINTRAGVPVTIPAGGSDTLTAAEAATLYVETSSAIDTTTDVLEARYTDAGALPAGIDLTITVNGAL